MNIRDKAFMFCALVLAICLICLFGSGNMYNYELVHAHKLAMFACFSQQNLFVSMEIKGSLWCISKETASKIALYDLISEISLVGGAGAFIAIFLMRWSSSSEIAMD